MRAQRRQAIADPRADVVGGPAVGAGGGVIQKIRVKEGDPIAKGDIAIILG